MRSELKSGKTSQKVTELPVNCPDLNRTVRTDPHQATYNFTPDFGADNVTKSALGYRYHGDAVSVNITLGGFPVGESVSIGTHEVVAIIFDDELEKKCTGIYIVEDDQPPNVTCSNQTILLGNVVSNYDVTVSDNVDEPSSLLINYAPKRPGQRLDLGINEISVNVTDLSGNINNAICYIDIQMTELPVDVIDAIAVSTGGTSFLSFNYRLNEDLTVHNFSFYGDGIDESIFVNGEGPQLGVLSSEVNNIVINATDGVLSKTFQFVLTVERNQTVSRILSGNVTLARIGDIVADFTDDLMDNSSTSYIDTAKEIQAQLDMIFRNTSGFIASRVILFRPGSVIATFVLIYDSSSSVTAEEATDIFRKAITSNDEVNPGSGLYLSSSTSFFISFPCGRLICENDGICTITNDGSEPMCRCTDDWTGDRCEIPNAQPNRVGIIVGATASALFLIIVTISLVMIAVRNRMIRMYQSSQDPSEFAPTYFTSHRDYSDESRGKPIVRHSKQEETKDYPYWNYAMDKDLVLFNKYKSRQQRRPSHNFRTRPYSTRRSPNHEPMHNGSRPTKNGIPLRDTYYVGHL
ncbi:uncharacterized protein LOC121432183 [Lytechinus variegatus]|uniref:uncharacterized protein LOC121432183 n=1 Tax=Lytechinus variegatus TaxID=7654 RepID=UPI001BB2C8A5|nr:uncharacterized protein LOC121432183 [Lytechinus variegatus]